MIRLYWKEYRYRAGALVTAIIISVIAVIVAFLINQHALIFCTAEIDAFDKTSFQYGYLLNYSSGLDNEYLYTSNDIFLYVPQADDFEASHLLDCCLTSIITIPQISAPERYILDFVTKHRFYTVCYSEADTVKLGIRDGYAKRLLARCGIDPAEAGQEDIKAALFLSKNPERLSGGQKKIANILSAIVRCEYSDLLIIDEPLNALDYDNVRLFSNIINRIHLEQPDVGMIIVTHCRALACLNRILTIENNTITEERTQISCNSCFGEMDSNGYYI